MFLLCHPWLTTTNLSYRLPILETSATASCGTSGIMIYWLTFNSMWSMTSSLCDWFRLSGKIFKDHIGANPSNQNRKHQSRYICMCRWLETDENGLWVYPSAMYFSAGIRFRKDTPIQGSPPWHGGMSSKTRWFQYLFFIQWTNTKSICSYFMLYAVHCSTVHNKPLQRNRVQSTLRFEQNRTHRYQDLLLGTWMMHLELDNNNDNNKNNHNNNVNIR